MNRTAAHNHCLYVCFFCICYINTSVFPNTIDFIFVFAGVRWCGNRRASHFLHLTWGLIYRCDNNLHRHHDCWHLHHRRNYHHYLHIHYCPPRPNPVIIIVILIIVTIIIFVIYIFIISFIIMICSKIF